MTKKFPRWLYFFSILYSCFTVPISAAHDPETQPEKASGYQIKSGVLFKKYAVASANPYASEAGRAILARGGSALDAAIAVQMVLGLVEPQSSGLGGGAFLLYWDGQKITAYDGRETAPKSAEASLFLKPDQKTPLDWNSVAIGGRAVGVPGIIPMLEMAHREHGRLPWADLFEPAIHLAETGFAMSPRLYELLKSDSFLKADPIAKKYFYQQNGDPWPIGLRLKNKPYAQILRAIAKQGAHALSTGTIAEVLIQKVTTHPTNPGTLHPSDLVAYQPKKRTPLCIPYVTPSQSYLICSFSAPNSGLLAIGQILGLLQRMHAEQLPLEQGLPSAKWLHLYIEAARLAFADRDRYIADPDFVSAPLQDWSSLLDPSYLTQRAHFISPTKRMPIAPAGEREQGFRYGIATPQIEYGTSHISIRDQTGHALSMTSSIEAQFGARQMVNPFPHEVGGFLLNNQLTDFSFLPYAQHTGQPTANRVEPQKRPRSTMTPLFVFNQKTGKLVYITGTPGGSAIIHYITQLLYGLFHWHHSPQQGTLAPHFGLSGSQQEVYLEEKRFPIKTIQALRQYGHLVREVEMTSGIQTLSILPEGLLGTTDPRREGMILGE